MSEEHAGLCDTAAANLWWSVDTDNAAFDVTPAESIAALVTKRCLIRLMRCAKVKEVLGR